MTKELENALTKIMHQNDFTYEMSKDARDLANTITKAIEKITTYEIIGITLIAIGIIIGIAILWNQHKLKKQLWQLREMLEEKEDKPD